MIGLPTSIELDSSATLQTTTFTSSGLAKYTSNLSGSLTNLSLPQKVYVDSLYTVTGIITSGKIPYTDTVSRLIPTKKYIDSVLLIYLVANGATIDANGRLTLPASGGTNGGIKVNGTLYLQTADTQSAGGGTVRAGLSGYYTLTSGTRGVMQRFASIVAPLATK